MAQGTLNKKLQIMHSVGKKPDSATELGGRGKSRDVSCLQVIDYINRKKKLTRPTSIRNVMIKKQEVITVQPEGLMAPKYISFILCNTDHVQILPTAGFYNYNMLHFGGCSL